MAVLESEEGDVAAQTGAGAGAGAGPVSAASAATGGAGRVHVTSALPVPLRSAVDALAALGPLCAAGHEAGSYMHRMAVLARLLDRMAAEAGRMGTPGRPRAEEAAGAVPPSSADECFQLALGPLAESGSLAYEYFGETTRSRPEFRAAVQGALRAARGACAGEEGASHGGVSGAFALRARGAWVGGLSVLSSCVGEHVEQADGRTMQTCVVALVDRRGVMSVGADTPGRVVPRLRSVRVPMFTSGDEIGHRTRPLKKCLA